MAIGERLKFAGERMGLTLGKVSEQVNIGVSSLSEFENNKRNPSMRQLHALAMLYKRSIIKSITFINNWAVLSQILINDKIRNDAY